MPPTVASPRRARLVAASLALVLLGSLIPLTTASAAAALTTPANDPSVSADETGTANYDTLTGPAITENGIAALGLGTIILHMAGAFRFKPATGAVGVSGSGCNLAVSFTSATATDVTATITGQSSVATCVLTFSGIQVQPTNGTLPQTGTITNTGSATGAPGGTYGTLTEVAGAPVLTFTASPSGSTASGANLSPQPDVHDEDRFGNDRSGDSISLSITAGTGTAGALLTCTADQMNTNGSGDADAFSNCKVDKAGTNYKLRASTTAVGGAIGDSTGTFNVTAGPANHLVFAGYPAVSSPALLSPQPIVVVADAAGNTVTTDSRTVSLSINQNAGTFSCGGGQSTAAVAGVATFVGCAQNTVANGYTLTAMATGLPNITGVIFNVTSGPPSKLTLCWGPASPCSATPPSPMTAATPFPLQPTVLIQDVNGNTVPNNNTTTVTLSILGGTPATGGPGTLACTGGNSKLSANGVASFSGCSIDKVGTGYRLLVTSAPVLTSTTSNLINIVAGAAVKLGFVAVPSAATAGTPFANPVVVAVQDAGGNVVSSGIQASIALSIGANPGAGTLTCPGGNVVTTVNGVATFTGCSISNQGIGYTLVASAVATSPATPLAPATSSGFTVAAPPAEISLTPSSTVIVWGDDFVLSVHFAKNGAGKTFLLQVTRDSLNWSTIATLTTDASGNASFIYGPSDNRFYRAVFAGTPDLSPGNSPIVRVVVRQTAALRPTNGGKIKTVSRGTNVTFSTTIRPNRPELPTPRAAFRVYQLTNGHWTVVIVRDVLANSSGVAQLTIAFSSSGQYYVRSWALPTPFNANSVMSPVERYTVN